MANGAARLDFHHVSPLRRGGGLLKRAAHASAMTQEAFDRGDWQAVIDAHRLESHDAAQWLLYGRALLHSIEPGPVA